MKTLKNLTAIFTAYLFLMSGPAWSAEKVVCTLDFTSAAAVNTLSPTTGSCTWPNGGNVLMQCRSAAGGGVDVYSRHELSTGGALVAADSTGNVYAYASNLDPIAICLKGTEKHISVRGVSASGTCYFTPTDLRRCPR